MSHWTKQQRAFTLSALCFVGLIVPWTQVNADSGSVADASMEVKVKVKDARNLAMIAAMGRELEQLREKQLALEKELRKLELEKSALRKELLEILKNSTKQNEKLERIRLSVAGTLASGRVQNAGEREGELLRALARTTAESRQLALKSIEFCEYVSAILEKMPLGKLTSASAELRMDELRKMARRICTVSGPGSEANKIEQCRILAINDALQVVVLPVGAVHGAVCNLMLYANGKGKVVSLQIVAVRPFVSGAIVLDGDISDLAVGTELYTDRNKLAVAIETENEKNKK